MYNWVELQYVTPVEECSAAIKQPSRGVHVCACTKTSAATHVVSLDFPLSGLVWSELGF